MPDQAARGPGGGGALPGAGYHSGLALMGRGFMLDNLTAHVPAAMQGWAPLGSLLEKRKYISCPMMTETLKEKSEKYSLRSREANDHSLNNTRIFLNLLSCRRKGGRKNSFYPDVESTDESSQALADD